MADALQASPTLTLVVIVRDEAPALERLLTWHRPLVDRLVVVDTGSRDESRAVAVAAGATLTEMAWCDDFSAARNHGLALVQQGWVLVLDCDELLSPADFPAVRTLCSGPPQGWLFDQLNYCTERSDPQWRPLPADSELVPAGADGCVTAQTCRLFPSGPDVRYQGVVHELPEASLRRAGLPLVASGLAIHHYGLLLTSELALYKNRRYANLLRNKLKKSPQDPRVRFEMAVQLVAEGQTTLAERLLERTVREDPQHPETLRARLLLGRLLLAAGRTAAAQESVDDAVRMWPAQRESWVAAGQIHAEAGAFARAAQYLRQGRTLFPTDPALRALESQVLGNLDDIRQGNARILVSTSD
jgi:hypothetical protein